ncbi:hypothetical protein KSF_095180 [Reticulibacter mediterranei]|uniref:Uncharacterized protein n=1 Tax=Reticulibacter mediterranei TaxID=2778369 RepID=A0A8J3IVW9_9CHLR|nr:hypothetical protein [Reticulibacter mediterranei]GHO99470.1 hypothetical protein KSF_095180 [Reticulibacter mediterranei]
MSRKVFDYAGLSSSPLKGVQGSPCRGLGCPQFPSLLPAPRAKEKKKGLCGDTPHPGKGLLPSALPLDGSIGKPCLTTPVHEKRW